MIYMGNVNYIYMSPGGDIPFAIIFAGGIFIVTESSAASHTIAISTIQEVVHKLDKKFIDMPDNIVSEDNIYDILENNLAPVAFTNDYDSLSGKPTDMIRYTAQTLTNEQAIQARANIGAAENYMLELVQQKIKDDCVRSDMVQSLTEQQKFRARENIGVINFSGDYNDLDNKPCEKIVVDEVTLVSGTVDFSADTTDSAHVNNTRKTPISDYMYRVIIGETTYYLSPVECYSPDSIYNYPCFALGNLFHMDNAQANTGEPFCIVFLETILVGSFSVQIYWDKTVLNTSMDVTVIQEEKVTYVQLDEEYIPDTIARTADIPTPDVSGQIGTHNTATDAHNDIRLLIEGLTTRLNTLADSDDTTLDQMSEIVAYIKSNKELIEGITTNKVSVSDIIDNLTTNVSNKPLSAAQGVALKALIDAITVPTKLSELGDDSTHRLVTDTERSTWSAKANVADIPTKVSELTNDAGYLTSAPVTSINNKTGAVTLKAEDITDVVPITRLVNGKALVNDIVLTHTDVGAEKSGTASTILATHSGNKSNPHEVTAAQVGAPTVEEMNTAISAIKVPTRSVVTNPKDQSVVTYFKISNFGTWYGLATNEKVSLLIGTRSGETILFTLAGENASTVGASALRLNDRYSKISGIYYKISENAIYVSLGAWANILSVDVLSDKSGNYTPIVEQINALPVDETDAAADAKLITVPIVPFGSHYANGTVIGNNTQNLALGGKNARPTYNGSNMALQSDIPSKTENWTFTLEDGSTVTKVVYVG
jgi:hypothetical protein